MIQDPLQRKMISTAAALMHQDKMREAAAFISDSLELGLKINDDDPKKYLPPLQYLLHWCLENNGLEQAAEMLWPPTMFNPNPQSSKDLWKLFSEVSFGLIMGGASLSKSYTLGARLFLEWIRDPAWTTIKVIGPSEDHLQSNLFSHLVAMHQQAKLPMPGEVGDLFIGMDRRNRVSSISGVVIPIGKVKKAGRLQGAKRKPRMAIHPVFGELSRLFVFIDEIENVPAGLWSDVDNLMSNVNEVDNDGLKIFGAYNPSNQYDEVGKRAEPPFGWADFDLDKHFRWTSTRGWEVLRLDGERCENVIEGKLVFPGLQTRNGLERIAKNAGGRQSPGYYTMGRGAYPPTGVVMTVFPPGLIQRMRGEAIWYEDPKPAASCDLALEGGASAVYTLGKVGLASGMKCPPSLEFPKGKIVMFKNEKGSVVPRWMAVAEQQFALPKGDTVKIRDELLKVNRQAGVRPEHFAADRTGNGAGVCDLLKNDWGPIIDINYSEGSSTTKVMIEDQYPCNEAYDRIASELWFGAKAWGEFGYFLLHPNFQIEKVMQQLTQRTYRSMGKKKKIESKMDYITRGFSSPDEADSLTLFLLAARRGFEIIPSMKGGAAEEGSGEEDDWSPWGLCRIDVTNRTEVLDESDNLIPRLPF